MRLHLRVLCTRCALSRETLPQDVMNGVMDLHHKLMRKLLVQHGGYESDTEGDSFIVAFATPWDALAFAQVRRTCAQLEGGTRALDAGVRQIRLNMNVTAAPASLANHRRCIAAHEPPLPPVAPAMSLARRTYSVALSRCPGQKSCCSARKPGCWWHRWVASSWRGANSCPSRSCPKDRRVRPRSVPQVPEMHPHSKPCVCALDAHNCSALCRRASSTWLSCGAGPTRTLRARTLVGLAGGRSPSGFPAAQRACRTGGWCLPLQRHRSVTTWFTSPCCCAPTDEAPQGRPSWRKHV